MTRGITAKKVVSWGSFILLFIVIGGYGIWRGRDLLFGIRISTVGITDGMTATSPVLEFSGTARKASGIQVDGEQVALSEDGTWQDSLALLDGYNIVTVAATDKFGRTTAKSYRVYYAEPAQPAVPAPTPTPTQ